MVEPTDGAPPHRYDAARATEIETRWQERWREQRTYAQPSPGEPGFDAGKPKFYCLDMFPYPSGTGLHVGHPEGYTATDIVSRYKRMRGYNVLHPMGWDAFGLPAEQYAVQTGVHPAVTTKNAIATFRRQLQRFGFSYDWERELGTIDESYYRFTQWIFLQIYGAWFDPEQDKARPIAALEQELASGKRAPRLNPDAAELSVAAKTERFGSWRTLDAATQRRILDSYRLAYVAEQVVNWCPKLGTALANEEVIDGRSERGGFPVFRKPLEQWMFRITAYAERLLDGLRRVDWPESTKAKQTMWIGRSEGAECDFALERATGGIATLRVFTTRPDTLFGATYMVVAPEHPLVGALLGATAPSTDLTALRTYVERARNRSDLERQADKSKTGVPTGINAINPATGKRIPIWVADYVLMGYGHGAIMAVPAHDERDYEFAKAFGLAIVQVVEPADGSAVEGCWSEAGRNVHSKSAQISLDGLLTAEAQQHICAWLEDQGRGRRHVNYKLRDWLFSRQRYWGEPFPIVWDEQGRHHPVAEDALPVKLPPLADFAPEQSDDPKPLLAKAQSWVQTTAGEAGVPSLPPNAKVTRETNTMPNWAGSCWYYLRYCDPKNERRFVGEAAERYWLGDNGVDLYIGGAEHGVLHLLYARFWHQALYDLGHVHSPEPFRQLFHQGLITSYAYQREDKSLVPTDQVEEVGDGRFVETATRQAVTQTTAKMSKSLKNVVNPDDVVVEYGADTVRLYEMYMGPLEASKPWNTRDITGLHRFLQRVWRLLLDEDSGALRLREEPDPEIDKLLHRTIAKVQDDIERLAFNTAIATLIKLVNEAGTAGGLTREQGSRFLRVLSPFAPHVAEELWNRIGEQASIALAHWPSYDPAQLVDAMVEMPIALKGKVRSHMQVPSGADAAALEKLVLADAGVQQLLAGKSVRKVIVVPGRMVNIVTD
ncbi:MAG: leucine--tRNA ligase [Polyangiales bacterium]